MKIRLGKLRQLIREAAGDGGVEAGKYYVVKGQAKWESEKIVKVLGIESSPRNPGMTFVEFKARPDSVSTMRRDVFEQDVVREATPEEVQQIEAAWGEENAYMSRTINTGREGT